MRTRHSFNFASQKSINQKRQTLDWTCPARSKITAGPIASSKPPTDGEIRAPRERRKGRMDDSTTQTIWEGIRERNTAFVARATTKG